MEALGLRQSSFGCSVSHLQHTCHTVSIDPMHRICAIYTCDGDLVNSCRSGTHLDALFARKKRLKEDDPVYRRWYVSLENWKQGIATAEVDAPNMFEPAAQDGEGDAEGAEPEVSVPVDPDCQRCALSGQKFETFWHEGEDEWHYRGAVRLEAPYGGAAAGSLVHVRCLPSEEGGLSGPDNGAPAAKKARVA